MKRFLSVLSLIFLVSFSSLSAQNNINSYKYLLVQDQYGFQKSPDQYQINSLTKFLFNKHGFNVIGADEKYPPELALNPCMALKAVVRNTSGMFSIKIVIDLVDCYNKVIFSTNEGKSSIKEFRKGYNDAIRKAFVSIEELNYQYNSSSEAVVAQTIVAAKKIDDTTAEVIKDATEVKIAVQNDEVKPENMVDVNKVTNGAVVAVPLVAIAPKETKQVEATTKKVKVYPIVGSYLIDVWGVCIISEKGEGYKLVGGENFEFATITKTSMPNIFMIKKTGFKDTQLLELDANGNLKIDSKDGFKVYNRVN